MEDQGTDNIKSLSISILEAKYFNLKQEIFDAKEEMYIYPNGVSATFLEVHEPHLKDLKESLNLLYEVKFGKKFDG